MIPGRATDDALRVAFERIAADPPDARLRLRITLATRSAPQRPALVVLQGGMDDGDLALVDPRPLDRDRRGPTLSRLACKAAVAAVVAALSAGLTMLAPIHPGASWSGGLGGSPHGVFVLSGAEDDDDPDDSDLLDREDALHGGDASGGEELDRVGDPDDEDDDEDEDDEEEDHDPGAGLTGPTRRSGAHKEGSRRA